MSNYRFDVGERVRFQAGTLKPMQTGIYEVLARLPQERGDVVSYRLRSTVDNRQRVADEHSLSRA